MKREKHFSHEEDRKTEQVGETGGHCPVKVLEVREPLERGSHKKTVARFQGS